MIELKAHPDGTLKAQGRINLANPTEYDGGFLTGSCDCCSIWPDTIAQSSGIVDLEQKRLYDMQVVAHFAGWTFQNLGASVTTPEARASGSHFDARFQLQHPLTSGSEYRAVISLTVGGSSNVWYYNLGAGLPAATDVEISVSIPLRLFGVCRDFGRYNYNGSIWGPRGAGLNDTVDLRGYISAEIGWYYWPPDGDATVTLKAFGQTWSLTDAAGEPGEAPVGPMQAGMYYAGFGDAGSPAWLEASGFDAPDIPLHSHTVWHVQDYDGARAYVEDRRITIYRVGLDPSSARGASLELKLMQPPQTLAVQALAYRADGTSYPAGQFDVQIQDGPDFSGYSTPYDNTVDTVFPKADAFGHSAAVPITISAPGEWQGTGEKYSYGASAHFGAPWYALTILDDGKDTIGAPPRLGFSYDPDDLDAQKQQGDAWRFPLTPQIAGAAGTNLFSWTALEIYSNAQKAVEEFGSLGRWSTGLDTLIENLGGRMRVYGSGTPLVVQGVFDTMAGFSGSRYVSIPCCGTGAARTAKLTIGTKEWFFPISQHTVPQQIILDLCAPFNAASNAYHSTIYEVGTGPGDWAWGVDDPVTMTLEFSGEVHVGPISLLDNGQAGFILAGESVHKDARWLVGSGGDARYVRDVLLAVLDGRVVLEEEAGRVQDDDPDKVTQVDSLQTLCDRAQTRQDAKLTKLTNLRPATGGVSAYWDFLFYRSWAFFNARQPAWMLRPGHALLPKDWDYVKQRRASVYAVMDYQCDRVVAHPGVSLTMVSRRMIGGAIYGLLVEDQAGVGSHYVAATGGADTEEDYTEANGMFYFPKAANLEVATSYTISPESAATHTHQGCAARVGMVHT